MRDFIQRVDDAVSGGQADPFALMHDDISFTVNGTTPLSGNYPSLEIVRKVLLSTAKRRIKSARISLLDCIGTGTRVGTLLGITARTVDNRTYNEEGDAAGCIFTVRGGKISRIHFFPDTHLIETVIFNQVLVSK